MLVLPILLLTVVAGCNESLKPAALALQQNNPVQALSLLEPLRSGCTQSSAFFEILGLANELSGNKLEAESALRTAVALDSKSSRLLTELGATLLQNGEPPAAAKVLNEALTLDPSNVVTLKYAAGAAVASQNWPQAAELFRRMDFKNNYASLQLEPILVLWFAQTMIETKRSREIDFLLSSPQRNAMPPGLLFSLATLFAQHGMYERAIGCLKQIPPENADDAVDFNLGLSYSHLHEFDDARQAYFQAIDKHPGHVDAYFHVGLDYVADGKPRMGIPWIYRARNLAPARTDVAYALVEQLIALEYFNTAKEILVAACGIAPHDSLLSVADGDLKRAQGDSVGATESYQRALADKPGFTAAMVGLSRVKIAGGKVTEARSLLESALSHDPQDPFVNGELGLLQAHQDDWQGALDHLGRAWAQDRSNPQIALQLARAYERKNRPLEALHILESVAPVMRDSAAFHFQLAQVYTVLHRSTDAQAERDVITTLQARSQDVLHFETPRTYVH
jgi:tetratricopeptide (TPR) repeat protein